MLSSLGARFDADLQSHGKAEAFIRTLKRD